MKKDGIYECKCYDIQMNPNFVCNDCRDRIICYVLLDRLPLIQKKCKKYRSLPQKREKAVSFHSEQEQECRRKGQHKTDGGFPARIFPEQHHPRNRRQHHHPAGHQRIQHRCRNIGRTDQLQHVGSPVAGRTGTDDPGNESHAFAGQGFCNGGCFPHHAHHKQRYRGN